MTGYHFVTKWYTQIPLPPFLANFIHFMVPTIFKFLLKEDLRKITGSPWGNRKQRRMGGLLTRYSMLITEYFLKMCVVNSECHPIPGFFLKRIWKTQDYLELKNSINGVRSSRYISVFFRSLFDYSSSGWKAIIFFEWKGLVFWLCLV